MLTKPIGTGLWGTALKRELVTEEDARDVIESMATLNRAACEAMVEVGVHAGTDVTGFGLLGHLHEMAEASGCAAEIDLAGVPLFERTMEWAEGNVAPGRTAEIVAWAEPFTRWSADADETVWMRILCDPQTSGGLLLAVAAGARRRARRGTRGAEHARRGRGVVRERRAGRRHDADAERRYRCAFVIS